MQVREFIVLPCNMDEIKDFVKKHHYSKNVQGVQGKFCFKMEYNGKLIGAAIVGRTAMWNTFMKYGTAREEILELRRLCCIDKTPKNTESYFIARILKYIKTNAREIKKIISYADLSQGHEGVIYKASNFKFEGQTKPTISYLIDGKKIHARTTAPNQHGETGAWKRMNSKSKMLKAVKNIYTYDIIPHTPIPRNELKIELMKPKTITYRKQTKTLDEWASELNVPVSRIEYRLKRGFPVSQVLSPLRFK